ncbi:hypothetical protein C477_01170 [Haloterrigena salina JCM 13891]|uniref:DUF7344 domain-containing protein n=1 Tax=Haloterrigena salina JCM 13891 TaxID=1227488 RepID=M0CMA3_9EURY|nr:hypothetical protein [Haloterrigena salina]ELZ24386.1 hypothetical protein C477_01170 [Haloterrigena salina JCM 13891]
MPDEESEGERTTLVDRDSETQTNPELASDGGRQKDREQRKLEGILHVLLDERRRYILYFLQEHEVSELDELATHVTAMEQETDPDAVRSERVKRVRISLVHADLPRLEDSRLVEFDRRSKAVRYSRPPELLARMLRLCANFDAPEIR